MIDLRTKFLAAILASATVVTSGVFIAGCGGGDSEREDSQPAQDSDRQNQDQDDDEKSDREDD
jgi:hypothetical protein